MEVIIPSPSHRDFDFNSAMSSPQASAPSTPRAFPGYYLSAPTSPSHLSHFYRDFDDGGATVPFGWEEKPGTPKSPKTEDENGSLQISIDHDFAFDVSQEWETASVSAEELFDAGVIKPLKPPPRMHAPSPVTSPRKKRAAISKKIIQGAFSPKQKNKTGFVNDPFAVAAQNAVQRPVLLQRGRERGLTLPKATSRRAARSLSPLRDKPYMLEEVGETNRFENGRTSSSSSSGSVLSGSVKGQKKWSFRDFFLFRSASEGRAADKDPLKKYTAAIRHSSFRSVESSGSGSGSRRKGRVSAHELHYTANRAVSEDLKKKTFLPYKQGILGRLAFNPTVHALANGFGFSRK